MATPITYFVSFVFTHQSGNTAFGNTTVTRSGPLDSPEAVADLAVGIANHHRLPGITILGLLPLTQTSGEGS